MDVCVRQIALWEGSPVNPGFRQFNRWDGSPVYYRIREVDSPTGKGRLHFRRERLVSAKQTPFRARVGHISHVPCPTLNIVITGPAASSMQQNYQVPYSAYDGPYKGPYYGYDGP